MDDLNLQPLLKTKRQQVSRACSNCRKAKTACSNHRPCQRCIKFNLQNSCEDAPRKQRANPDKKSKSKSPRRGTSTSPNMMSSEDMDMDESPNSLDFLQNNSNIAEIQYQQFMQPYQAPVYHPAQFLPAFQAQPVNQTFNGFLPQYSPPPSVPQQQQYQFAPPYQQSSPFPQFQQPQQPQPVQQNQFQNFSFNNQPNNNNNIDINIQPSPQPSNALQQLQQTTLNTATSAMIPAQTSFQEPSSKSTYTYPNLEEHSLDKIRGTMGSSGNLSFGSAGSLTELMKMRTPSLESLIVTVNSEITKKNKKEDSFSSIPI